MTLNLSDVNKDKLTMTSGYELNSPLEALLRFWNVLRILFHQVRSDAVHTVLDELRPIDGLHVEVEELLVFVVELSPKVLQCQMH